MPRTPLSIDPCRPLPRTPSFYTTVPTRADCIRAPCPATTAPDSAAASTPQASSSRATLQLAPVTHAQLALVHLTIHLPVLNHFARLQHTPNFSTPPIRQHQHMTVTIDCDLHDRLSPSTGSVHPGNTSQLSDPSASTYTSIRPSFSRTSTQPSTPSGVTTRQPLPSVSSFITASPFCPVHRSWNFRTVTI